MKRNPIEVFGEWADLDKDFGMQKNHKNSVQHMLDFVLKDAKPFSFIDAGCGNGWNPEQKVDIVHSMEVFYYLKDPRALIQRIFDYWLKTAGRLIIGIDFYLENQVSHDWPESFGIDTMKLFSEKEWSQFFTDAGFHSVKTWRFGKENNWEGTLIVTGLK